MVDIKLIQGDCLEKMKDIPDGSIDLTVTSPPYDNLRSYNGNNALWGEHVWKAAIKDLYRVTKDGGVVVGVVADATIKGNGRARHSGSFVGDECSFQLRLMIYQTNKRRGIAGGIKTILSSCSFCQVPKTFNPRTAAALHPGVKSTGGQRRKDGRIATSCCNSTGETKLRGNIWYLPRSSKSGDQFSRQHPATFPEALAHDHIISWSNEGDTVFDPFMGSGTTGKMAAQLGRNFIGIELDEGYFKIAQDRINQAVVNTNKRMGAERWN